MMIAIPIRRALAVLAVLGMFAMWIYALAFSPRESINSVYDDLWSQRAAVVCGDARAERETLADYRTIDEVGADALNVRADLVERASGILERMVDQLAALPRATDKADALVPMWIADWRIHLSDRAAYVAQLRVGDNRPFTETRGDRIPLSEKIATFAADNLVPDCSPPRDLAL